MEDENVLESKSMRGVGSCGLALFVIVRFGGELEFTMRISLCIGLV